MEPPGVVPGLAAELSLLYTYQTATNAGTVLSSMLFGIFCVQLYHYATSPSSRNESRWIHCLVAAVTMIEVVHTVLLWVYLMDVSRGSLLQPLYILSDPPSLILVLCMSGIAGALVQSYYAYRIYRLSGLIWLAIVPWAGSLARAGITLAGTVTAFTGFHASHDVSILEWISTYGWVMKGTFGASVGVDVLNTALLCIILSRHRDINTGTSLVVDKLMIWTVETGMLTSIIAVLLLAFILAGRYEILPGLVHVYPNMFSLSLLLSLNAREGLRRALHAKPVVTSFGTRTNGSGQRVLLSPGPAGRVADSVTALDKHPYVTAPSKEEIEMTGMAV